MLIIPKDMFFKHAAANNVQAFSIIKSEELPALIDLIGLITFADFNRFEFSDNRFQNFSQFEFPALVSKVYCSPLIIILTKDVVTLLRQNGAHSSAIVQNNTTMYTADLCWW